MVVAINYVKNVEGLTVDVTITGLTIGTRYDVMRLQMRYVGDTDLGVPIYERELPDRRDFWSSVAHRVGWQAPTASVTFRDYECPTRPVLYFVVPTASVGPHEWDFHDGDYPIQNGVLDDVVIHFNRDFETTAPDLELLGGDLLVRSSSELGMFARACVYDMEELSYAARGTKLDILGTPFPSYVAATRQARAGRVILKTDSLGEYDDLRRIIYPPSGLIAPVLFQSGPDATLLLDDMRTIPLDVTVEQATQRSADVRFIGIDFIEVDPTIPLGKRTGDNESLVTAPVANFTIDDNTPARNQWVTLTDTSTGTLQRWEWTVRGSSNKVGKFYVAGPHKVRWSRAGTYRVKLRVSGTDGASVTSKAVTVH